jgi:ketosteroid isomerase-like protein
MSGDAALRELLDRAAVRDVLYTYARGVDRKDIALVASCFTADCAYEGSLGRTDVRDALARLERRWVDFDATMHFMGNCLIDLDGDVARSETYCVAYHRRTVDGVQKDLTVAVRYNDEMIRQDGRWRIRRRHVVTVWTRDDLVPPTG